MLDDVTVHGCKIDSVGHSINLEVSRSMHSCIKPFQLVRVEVTNRSDLMERIMGMVHMMEQRNEQKNSNSSETI